ncbi:growth/differentiation factor 5-like [Argiope bruennichi]|nr:growth/differentiation factor 5-like [Argiope bruennichi]
MDKEMLPFITAKLSTYEYDANKVEVYLEFHGLSEKKTASLDNRKFIIDVQPFGNKEKSFNTTSSPASVIENAVELTFEITSLYNTSKEDHVLELNFTFNILRKNGRTAKSLMKNPLKAFLLVYETVESCSFLDFVNRERRFRRSITVNQVNSDAKVGLKPFTASADFALCKVTPFPVNFTEIGLDWIVYPEVQDIGSCRGICPMKSVVTGYGLIQTICFENTKRGQPPSCYPSEFGSMTIIYTDYLDNRPVIAKFSDMIVKKCKCI